MNRLEPTLVLNLVPLPCPCLVFFLALVSPASEGQFEGQAEIAVTANWKQAHSMTLTAYKNLIDAGMAKEQARCILPLTLYTEVYWTTSFQAVMNFIELRNEKTAQIEIQEYARVLLNQMKEVFPKTTELWSDAHGW